MFGLKWDMTKVFIDTIQETKSYYTDEIVKDEVLNKACHDFIKSQTEFAYMLKNNFVNVSKYYVDTQTNYLFPKRGTKDEQNNNSRMPQL
jgi:hypothetical protein